MALLALEKVSKRFPGVRALNEVSLQVEAGEIHALLGENGAGKSTLMKILCGIHQPDSGEILIDGTPQHFSSYRRACAAGVGIVFQEFSLIPGLSVVDNIFLGREPRNRLGLIRHGVMLKQANALFERLDIDIDPQIHVHHLSVADQQFVEIAKALSLNARVLVLDEPTAPLTPTEVERLFTIMRQLREQGVAMVFISHHMEEIFEICDRVTVLRDGEYVTTLEVADTDAGALVELMVGRRVDNIFPDHHSHADSDDIVLEARIRMAGRKHTDYIQLARGEILGFAGLVGSGRTEMALAMIGAQPVTERQMQLEGHKVTLKSPADALKRGIGLLPENRKQQGLILPFTCADNITLNHLKHFQTRPPFISRRREREAVEALMDRVRVKAPGSDTVVGTLSGGNQQKVVIARWLERGCRVLIFDEPTRGIDVGAKSEIYALMKTLTAQGISIVMISSELPEITGLCDRVLVFNHGHVVAALSGDEIEAGTIMTHATRQISLDNPTGSTDESVATLERAS
ncbi:sugar ABC transporter ATP-binding protein [Kushneria indalinina]|uniref:Monosaccharide ABC transporter ATP-binding protein (CUT2 family) n=1 Tax=Kushneria indalinina DSM 14324 TaxID=1122140 RepID=A0A3D9DSF3_9GAMM|nr:sugar ABC transporter ATP-binding protein [Kushneria indalinina]REC93585.1 monosaccharide ABC transporter ATP-binding protein (CUT2 family) [Kushneria indalinina DSM 14324]